jgi:alkanesulfonate monooxygenase SsuD/methylene tetrahydromethanopterin reductase-like flavin-dependent oxidoreductase (luciferase family)
MYYDLGLPNMCPGGDFRALVNLAIVAEEAGWDGIFVEDYITHWKAKDAPTCDPWILLAAIAEHTQHVLLGTSVSPLSRRRPWKVAREAVTIDRLSNGRCVLGIGLGDTNDPGFGAVGEVIDARERAAMLDEELDILAGLWSGQPFSYQGKHYQIGEVTFLPTPVQQPRIPIWVGASLPHKGPVRRAARWDGIMPFIYTPDRSWRDMTPDDVRALRTEIASQRTISTPFTISLGGRQRNPNLEQELALIKSLAEAGATRWSEYIEPDLLNDMQACIEHVKEGPPRID